MSLLFYWQMNIILYSLKQNKFYVTPVSDNGHYHKRNILKNINSFVAQEFHKVRHVFSSLILSKIWGNILSGKLPANSLDFIGKTTAKSRLFYSTNRTLANNELSQVSFHDSREFNFTIIWLSFHLTSSCWVLCFVFCVRR